MPHDLARNENNLDPPTSPGRPAELLSVDAERFGAVPVSGRALYTLLESGQPTLLYPGGMREALKSTKRGEGYRLVGWPEGEGELDFVRIAARFGAKIVTVASVGAEESFAMLLDADEVRSAPLEAGRLLSSGSALCSPQSCIVAVASCGPGRAYTWF